MLAWACTFELTLGPSGLFMALRGSRSSGGQLMWSMTSPYLLLCFTQLIFWHRLILTNLDLRCLTPGLLLVSTYCFLFWLFPVCLKLIAAWLLFTLLSYESVPSLPDCFWPLLAWPRFWHLPLQALRQYLAHVFCSSASTLLQDPALLLARTFYKHLCHSVSCLILK